MKRSTALLLVAALVATYPVGNGPHKLVFDGSHIWVTNNADDTVSRLRVSDGMTVGTYPVGDAPSELVFDGTHIWVGNMEGDSVSKLRAFDSPC